VAAAAPSAAIASHAGARLPVLTLFELSSPRVIATPATIAITTSAAAPISATGRRFGAGELGGGVAPESPGGGPNGGPDGGPGGAAPICGDAVGGPAGNEFGGVAGSEGTAGTFGGWLDINERYPTLSPQASFIQCQPGEF